MQLPKGQPTSEGIYSCLPVFPLREVHLFPETLLPLHIFEPRYRQMIQDSLKAESFIGIILPDLKEDPKAYEPNLVKIGGIGKIQYHELLEDGRYNIVLQGIEKFELLEELKLSDILYRVVRAKVLKDKTTISQSDENLIRQELFSAFSLTFSPFFPEKILNLSEEISLEKFVNLVASSLKVSSVIKQELLEMDSLEDRAIRILRILYESTNPQRFYRRIRQSKPSPGNMN